MATKGRVEGIVTVPTGGWGGTVAGTPWTLPAGDYFLSSAATIGSSLVQAVDDAIDSVHANTFTCTVSAGESGTGKVTITSSGAVAIVWTDTELRDLLGFDSDLASGTTWTGANQARSLWLPDCHYRQPNTSTWRGWRESDFIATETAAGHVHAWQGNSLQANELSWGAISRERALIAHETTVNASWERFALDCLWGLSPWGMAGGPIRFYPDAASSSVFCTYYVPEFHEINPAHWQDGWARGPRVISLPRLVAAPAYASYG